MNTNQELGQTAEQRTSRKKIRQPRHSRHKPRPAVDLAERVMPQWTRSPVKMMRQKLRLVGRNIYIDRTVAFAAFAREAQIQRRFHMLILPAIANNLAAGHLPEQMRATASRVLLLTRDPE